MKVLVENTTYSLLIYLLISKENDWKETNYIFSYQIPSFIKNNLIKKIENKKILTELPPNSGIFIKIKSYYQYYFKVFFKFLIKKDIQVYGNDNILYMTPFRWRSINIIEDGIINYIFEANLNKISRVKRLILLGPPNYKSYGFSKKVKKIFLTGLAQVPEEIKSKVEIINLKELWNKKSLEEQREISSIFGIQNFLEKNYFLEKIIFLTQPLSEDNLLTLEEEIKLYENIFKNYDITNIVIKVHPREIKDYKKYFPKVEVLDKEFPFEFFKLMDIKIKKVVTIFSTAALNLSKDTEIDFYGTKIHPKLLEKCGEINIEQLKKEAK